MTPRPAYDHRVSSLQRWVREFGRPPRILGLDVARGLAIIGMAGAHIGDAPDLVWSDPETWAGIVHGRSSILFAVLAGVSVALMTGRSAGPDPQRLPSIRLGLVGRGAVVFVIGILLEYLNTPIAVILTLYGLIYVAVIPFLRWRPWQLLAAAGGLALLGPAVLALVNALTLHPFGAGIGFVISGSYPITVWMAFVFAGMALGRLHVDTIRTATVTLFTGIGLAIIGYGLGAVGVAWGAAAEPGIPYQEAAPGWDGYPESLIATDPIGSMIRAVLAVDAHSGGTAEILGSGGFALAVIGACLLASRAFRVPLLPLGALGSMPLSAYSAHILVIALISGPGAFYTDGLFWVILSLGLILVATVWSVFAGQGPLERLTARAARAMAAPPSAARPRLDA